MWLPKMADNLCKSYFRSQCAVWVENCELLSRGNIWELTVILTLQDKQFLEKRVEKGDIKDNKYHNKVQLDIFIYYPIDYLGRFCN